MSEAAEMKIDKIERSLSDLSNLVKSGFSNVYESLAILSNRVLSLDVRLTNLESSFNSFVPEANERFDKIEAKLEEMDENIRGIVSLP